MYLRILSFLCFHPIIGTRTAGDSSTGPRLAKGGTGLYYGRLNEQKQAYLRGGCDLDCLNAGKNCWVRQECTQDSNCYGLIYACDDETEEETCQKSGSWGIPCTYDSAHNCGPKKKIAPKCGGTHCMLGQYLNDLCTGMTKEWIHQCHDGW
jgi:hypothetical protein